MRYGADAPGGAESLLEARTAAEPLEEIRARAAGEIGALPERLRALTAAAEPYLVRIAEDLAGGAG